MSPLRLKPSVTLYATRLGALLCSDLGAYQIGGADALSFLQKVAPALDGTRDREGVIAALPGFSRASVLRVIDLLLARGLVEEVPEGGESPRRSQDEFLQRMAPDPAAARARLAAARVLVAGDEPWAEVAAAEIAAAGAREVRQGEVVIDEGWSLLVGAVEGGYREGQEALSRAAHRARLPSLWAQIGEDSAVIGPLVIPGETACRVCALEEALHPRWGASGGGDHVSRAALVGHLLALEALKVISGVAISTLGGRVSIVDLATLESRRQTLVRIPWCRVCGEG